MKIGKVLGWFDVVFCAVVLFSGCSGGSGNSSGSPGYDTYTTSDSDLVLKIPDSMAVSQGVIEDIHYSADLVGHCRTTDQEPVNIVLAEACVAYDERYLFPEYLPANLDDLSDVSDYVSYMGENDPFTYYFSPEYFEYVMTYYDGDAALIGFSTTCSGTTVTDETPLIISSVDRYTRAWIDGFEAGDHIVKINGAGINGMSLDAINALIPTTEEEPVEITVERDDVSITISTAAEENISLLLYGDIAYLNARSFTAVTGEELRLDFEEMQASADGAIDKLILDLRSNGGGMHSGTLMLADYLIDKDDGTYPIMSYYGPAIEEKTEYLGDYNDFNIGAFDSSNFVLLVDGSSASASEIVAAALKYYDTAYLIGTTTYGKGLGQSVIELIDGSGVAIPSRYSLPPSGESYHDVGIDPDYYHSAWPTSFDDDPVLEAAVSYLETGHIGAAASGMTVLEKEISVTDESMDPLLKNLLKRVGSCNHH